VAFLMFENLPVDASARAKSLPTVLNEMVVSCATCASLSRIGLAALWFGASRGLSRPGTTLLSLACSWLIINLCPRRIFRRREKDRGPQPQLLQPSVFGDLKLLVFILIFSCVWALYSRYTNIPLFILSLGPRNRNATSNTSRPWIPL